MAVEAVIKDGKIQETQSESSIKKATAKNGLDKDAFLQLLVAQMKYQDPLEPTSNTEYISQYATFSQVEQMQNMASSMELSRASSMVGKLVNIETTTAAGEEKSFQGVVEYVTYEANKAYVSIDGTLYSTDDVTAVIDETYQTAVDLALAFVKAMDKLPSVSDLQLGDKEAVTTLQEGYNSMTSYQQSFITKDYVTKLQKYVDQMAGLEDAAKKVEEEKAAEIAKAAEAEKAAEEATKAKAAENAEEENSTNNAETAANTDSNADAETTGNDDAEEGSGEGSEAEVV